MSGLFEYCKFFVGDKCRVDEILVWSIASFKTHLILKIPFKHLNTPKRSVKMATKIRLISLKTNRKGGHAPKQK